MSRRIRGRDLPHAGPFGIVLGMEQHSPKQIDPQAEGIRRGLRVLGPLLLAAGLICVIVALVDFFSVMNNPHAFSGPPKRFWLFFIGGPIAFVGFVMTSFAYMGRVARFQAHELTPVATDTANVMAAGIRPALRDAAGAIREGLTGEAQRTVACISCGTRCDADARFCKACGQGLPPAFKDCPRCESMNDADAKFCDECGSPLA